MADLVVVTFDVESDAREALHALRALEKEGVLHLTDTAVVAEVNAAGTAVVDPPFDTLTRTTSADLPMGRQSRSAPPRSRSSCGELASATATCGSSGTSVSRWHGVKSSAPVWRRRFFT
jgi:hypothetical protein